MGKEDFHLKRLYQVFILLYVVTLLYGFYINYRDQDYNAFAMGGVACLTPLIVPILFKLLKFKPVYEIYLVNIVFVYFASLIGSSFHGYSLLGFDKVLHFSSGLIFTIVAMMLFMVVKKVKHIHVKEDYLLYVLFINMCNLSIAVIWEFYEYAMLIFFNNDCINHFTQGVHDAITDMLCAFVGGLIITYLVHHAYKNKKNNFVLNLCEKFYSYNVEHRLSK